MEKKFIHEYDIVRIFSTLLVVIGHCAYYTITTQYGGVDYTVWMNQNSIADTIIHKLFSVNVTLIATFLMPLFFALSGAMFNISLRENKFTKFRTLLSNKSRKLLIPYLLVGLFYVVPLKYITGYFSTDHLIRDILAGQILGYGNTHLWFLMSLFWVFVFAWIIEKYVSPKSRWLAFCSVIILFIFGHTYTINFLWIGQAFQDLFWFYVGYIFEYYRVAANKKFFKRKVFFLFALFITYLSLWVLYEIFHDISVIHIGANFLISFLGITISYFISLLLSSSRKILESKGYFVLRKYSMEIYLFSDPLNYIVLYILSITHNLTLLGSESGSFFIIIIRIVGTIVVSVLIGYFLNRLKSMRKAALRV